MLELHARFSLVSDIARIYVTVSKKYIRPGIRKMDRLTNRTQDEYETELESFKAWSKEAVKGIEKMANNVHLLRIMPVEACD